MTNQPLLNMPIYEGYKNSDLNENKTSKQIKKEVTNNLKNI
jgi:hypothetical protein